MPSNKIKGHIEWWGSGIYFWVHVLHLNGKISDLSRYSSISGQYKKRKKLKLLNPQYKDRKKPEAKKKYNKTYPKT